MPRTYTAYYQAVGVTTPATLMAIQAPTGKSIRILNVAVTSPGTDAGQIECCLQAGSPGGSGSTPVTPYPNDLGDAAAASTVTANLAAAPLYTGGQFGTRGQPIRSGYYWNPSVNKGESLTFSAGQFVGLRSLGTLSTVTLDIEVVFEELG